MHHEGHEEHEGKAKKKQLRIVWDNMMPIEFNAPAPILKGFLLVPFVVKAFDLFLTLKA